MAIWAALIGTVGGGILNAQGGKEGKKGNRAAQANINAAKNETNVNLGPYAGVGNSALYQLAQLSGIEGYRTDAERAYTDFLATKPTYSASANERDYRSTLDKQEEYSTAGDVLGGVTKYYDDRKKKRQKRAAADNAARLAAYKRKLAEWEAKSAELKAESDKSLVGYDPGKAQSDYLRSTPGYSFRFDEGIRGLDASGSARGDMLSGAQKKRLSEFGQGLASQEYGNEFSRLMQLAGIGQNAATVKSNVAVGSGSNLANLSVAGGNQAAGRWDNYNDLFQGGIRDYSYLSRRDNNRTSSFDSPTDNPDYRPGQTLAPEDYN